MLYFPILLTFFDLVLEEVANLKQESNIYVFSKSGWSYQNVLPQTYKDASSSKILSTIFLIHMLNLMISYFYRELH